MQMQEILNQIESGSGILNHSPALTALILAGKAQWDEAHATVQDETDRMSAAVHAYLHRREGDIWNANHWYRQAGRKPFSGSLEDEWLALVREHGVHPAGPTALAPAGTP